eukprot:gene10111-biopygen15303
MVAHLLRRLCDLNSILSTTITARAALLDARGPPPKECAVGIRISKSSSHLLEMPGIILLGTHVTLQLRRLSWESTSLASSMTKDASMLPNAPRAVTRSDDILAPFRLAHTSTHLPSRSLCAQPQPPHRQRAADRQGRRSEFPELQTCTWFANFAAGYRTGRGGCRCKCLRPLWTTSGLGNCTICCKKSSTTEEFPRQIKYTTGNYLATCVWVFK